MRFPPTALLFVLVVSFLGGCAAETEIPTPGAGRAGDALSGRPYFEVWQTGSQHYFHFSATNHEIVLQSEGYASRVNALNGVLSVLDHGGNRASYQTRQATNGQWYFVLRAVNGEIIAMSEMYVSRWNADRGADSVVTNVNAYLDWQANQTGARFDIFRGSDSRWYFSLHAANGEVVLQSQGYQTSEAMAYNGALSVKENGTNAARYVMLQAANGEWYFNLRASNGQVIGTSETYSDRSKAEQGRDAVIALLPTVELL
jgi:uncharacterized protein YegP (UPF0339 family)